MDGEEKVFKFDDDGVEKDDGGGAYAKGFDPGEQREEKCDQEMGNREVRDPDGTLAELFHIYCQTGKYFSNIEVARVFCRQERKVKKAAVVSSKVDRLKVLSMVALQEDYFNCKQDKRKGAKDFIEWLDTKPIDRHLAKTMTPVEVKCFKDKNRSKKNIFANKDV